MFQERVSSLSNVPYRSLKNVVTVLYLFTSAGVLDYSLSGYPKTLCLSRFQRLLYHIFIGVMLLLLNSFIDVLYFEIVT